MLRVALCPSRFALCLALLTGAFSPIVAQPASNPAPAPPASATATNPLLTLGPEVLTFPEIAQQLSVGGHKVTCSPALEQYAAYVSLKNRMWDKTRHLLEQGLQVQFHADKDNANTFTLEWDSDTRRRERAWLVRYAENLQLFLQEQLQVRAGYLSLPFNTLKQQHESAKAEIQSLETKQQTETLHYRQLDAINSGIEDSLRVSRNVDEQLGFAWAQSNLLSTTNTQNLLFTGGVYSLQNLNQIPDKVLEPVLAAHANLKAEGKPVPYGYIACGWRLSANGQGNALELNTRIVAINGLGIPLLLMYIPLPQRLQDVFVGLPSGDPQHIGGLGKAAIQWLQSETQVTQRALTDARMHSDLLFHTQDGSGDASRLVEAWSRRHDAEAIMVLWPQREAQLGNLTANKATLAAMFDPVAGTWALSQTDGVMYIRNLMAFVDREQTLPVAALVQFARPKLTNNLSPSKEQDTGSSEEVSPFDRLRAYCKAAASSRVPFWSCPLNITTYRGVGVGGLDKGVGGMFLWDNLPTQEYASLRTQLRASAGNEPVFYTVPLSRFDVHVREKLLHLLHGWNMEYSQVAIPEFSENLSSSNLYIQISKQGVGKPYRVSTNVRGLPDSGFFVWGCQARFLWQP